MKSPFKHIIYFAAIIVALLFAGCSCNNDREAERLRDIDRARIAEILRPDAVRPNPYEYLALDSMPPGGRPIKIRHIGGSLGSVFRDMNDVQLDVAARIGINPITNNDDIWNQPIDLVRINSDSTIYVDRLSHSAPFLVPKAEALLRDIGRAFVDSLQARGGGAYRLKVTSLLRTARSVASLRRRNVNAVGTSAHLFGTTFDISYAKFICDDDSIPRTQADLKNLLAEILADLRNQGRCYVKYEVRQACFHITTR